MRYRSGWFLVWMCLFCTLLFAGDKEDTSARCLACHKENTPGLYQQWLNSAHSEYGVTCLACHRAEKEDADAFLHHDAYVAAIVTPKDCGECHTTEKQQVENSYHAQAGKILESNDAYLAHVAGGHPVAIQGCESCHGAKVKVDPSAANKLSPLTWPNSGIGRINPDGSLGSCNACHSRHAFTKVQSRQPESCSKCHLGPDHPQKEVYEASKHGNAYYTQVDKMNLAAERWIVGEDYYAAPTCATCHMSASPEQAFTHDVGERISWTLRPVVSTKKENWRQRRENMRRVCRNCHAGSFVHGHYVQFDATVRLYNEKFAEPAMDVMDIYRRKKIGTPAAFSNTIEWTFWELWHHEGRRARHGASMMGPDYTWWHGMYEVAKHFYFKFIPQARQLDDPEINKYLDDLPANDPMHQWLNEQTPDLKQKIRSGKMQDIYEKMFEPGE